MHPQFDVHQVLQIVGPTASLLFAAWIFLQYLNQRFIESVARLRELAENLRTSETKDDRRSDSLRDQIGLYRRRCTLMRQATNVGLVAALMLLSTLTLAGIVTVFGRSTVLDVVGVCTAIGGLVLVMVATGIVFLENRLVAKALTSELTDLEL